MVTFNSKRAMAMTDARTKGSPCRNITGDRLKTDGRTDGRTEAIALPPNIHMQRRTALIKISDGTSTAVPVFYSRVDRVAEVWRGADAYRLRAADPTTPILNAMLMTTEEKWRRRRSSREKIASIPG